MNAALLSLCVLLGFIASVSSSFDWATANSSVWLSAGAYCETNTYMTRTYKGYSTGFVPSYVIDDKANDVQVRSRSNKFSAVEDAFVDLINYSKLM